MSLSALQESLIPAIEASLKDFFNAQDFGNSQNLREMIAYHMGWADDQLGFSSRGKRIRPFLLLLCTGALQEDIKGLMPGAVSLEFLHNFTLIHDDIEDVSPLRHGRSTLWKIWGVPQAINAGDALFSIAQMSMLSLRNMHGNRAAALAVEELNRVCLHLTQGQFLDLSFESDSQIELETYLEMIQGKTAGLIALSTSLCALITEKSASTYDSLYEFGENLGLAFQIQDDILGIWGKPEVTGKSSSSDLHGRKKSLPVLFGLKQSPQFQSLWSKDASSQEELIQMSDLLQSCGALDYAQSKAAMYTKNAFNALETLFPEGNEYANALFELAKKLLIRRS